MKLEDINLHSTEIAFSLPMSVTNEQLDELRDRLATQYADVASVLPGVCNDPLITITFLDLPCDSEVKLMKRHILALCRKTR